MTAPFLSKRRARMIAYMDENPNEVFTSGYDETISDAEAQMILDGDFDAFEESIWENMMTWGDQGYLWSFWEGEFATAFGYDKWSDMPERLIDYVRENATLKTDGFIRDLIRHWRGNITATILKPGAKDPENLIYAPGDTGPEGRKLARYLVDAFGVTLKANHGTMTERLMQDIEVVYGGYDMEQLTLCGRMDLFAIYESRKAPTHVKIGPEDSENLLFYDHHNGCGNMGTMAVNRTRTMPARLRVDGSHGYGVDACYGFTGDWWRHDIRVT